MNNNKKELNIFRKVRTVLRFCELGKKIHKKNWTNKDNTKMFWVFATEIYVNSNYNNKLLDKYYKVCNKWVKQ